MKEKELIDLFEKQKSKSKRFIQGSALIQYQGERGLALEVGENLTESYLSGDIIVFWENGEHTVLPEDFKLIKSPVYR